MGKRSNTLNRTIRDAIKRTRANPSQVNVERPVNVKRVVNIAGDGLTTSASSQQEYTIHQDAGDARGKE